MLSLFEARLEPVLVSESVSELWLELELDVRFELEDELLPVVEPVERLAVLLLAVDDVVLLLAVLAAFDVPVDPAELLVVPGVDA